MFHINREPLDSSSARANLDPAQMQSSRKFQSGSLGSEHLGDSLHHGF
jgi:hypothetical protein